MAERCFAPAELAYWRGLPESQRVPAFFSFWTCKEAFIKAVGEGVFLGLEHCVIGLEPKPRLLAAPERCGDPEAWELHGLNACAPAHAALCTNKGPICLYVDNISALFAAVENKPQRFDEID
jgi:4'-phosphopantetheinyl transferase